MICQWQSVINVLPAWMRQQVDEQGRIRMQELRLRLGQPPELCMDRSSIVLSRSVTPEDLRYTVNAASRYSPWACSSASKGFITLPGGHRIGLCGDMVVKQGEGVAIRWISSLCLRISRDFPGISQPVANSGSILIVGAPGSGKTSLLRDLVRSRSNSGCGSIAVIDERCEIFPVSQDSFCYAPGKHTDVLTGCPKNQGIDIALRCLGPTSIAVDEITAPEDCQAIMSAGWCGVSVLATAHAGSRSELFSRPVYKPFLEAKLFDTLILMNRDKSYHTERMT